MKTIFLKSVILVSLLFSLSVSKAQNVSIPDTAFGQFLYNYGYTACMTGSSQSGWYLDTTCSAAVPDTFLYLYQSNISDLTGLQYLTRLKYIDCYFSGLDTLPALPDSLIELNCESNHLRSLPRLPATLTTLYCSGNVISVLPTLPPSLKTLWCADNRLASLPILPASLIDLNCSSNLFTKLPSLPDSLLTCYCAYNILDSLPILPRSLKRLYCQNNLLKELPALPHSLRTLACSHNLLAVLPVLDANLDSLICSYNPLYQLPALPSGMRFLGCDSDMLSDLPPLPSFLIYFNCSNNSRLLCLPHLDTIIYFYFDSIGAECISNYPALNNTSSPALNSVALCGLSNVNGCIAAGISIITPTSLRLLPNPTNDHVVASSNQVIDEVVIVNATGQQVYHVTNILGTSISINVSTLDSGLYYTRIKTRMGTVSGKLVIQK